MTHQYLTMLIDEKENFEFEFIHFINRLNENLEDIVSCKIYKVYNKDAVSNHFIADIVSLSDKIGFPDPGVSDPSEEYDYPLPFCAYFDIDPKCGLKLSKIKIQVLHDFYLRCKDQFKSMITIAPLLHYGDIYDFEKFARKHFEFFNANKNEIIKGAIHAADLKGTDIKSNYFSTLEYLFDRYTAKVKFDNQEDFGKNFCDYYSKFITDENIFSFIGSTEQSACIEYLDGVEEGIFSTTYKLNQYTNPYNVSILRRIGETGYRNGYIDNLIANGFDYNQLKVIKNACELQIPSECINTIVYYDCDPIIMETYVYAVNYNKVFGSPFTNESFNIILKSGDSHKARLMLESIIDGSFNKMKKYFEDPEYNILQLKIIKMGIDDDLEILYADKSYSAVDMFFLYLAHKNISNEPMRFLETDEIKELISDKILSDINKLKPEDSKVNFIGDYISINLDKMYMDWEASFVDNINRTDSIRLIDTDRYGYKNPQEFLNIRRNCKKF